MRNTRQSEQAIEVEEDRDNSSLPDDGEDSGENAEVIMVHPEKAAKPNVSGRKRVVVWTIRAALLAVLVLIPWLGFRPLVSVLTHESTDDAFVEGNIIPVASQVSGRVVEVLVQEHQQVRAGQPIVRVDSEDYAITVREKEAGLEESRGVEQQLIASQKEAAQAVNQAEAEVGSQQASLDLTARQKGRLTSLANSGTISASEFDNGDSAWKVALAKVASARAAQAKSVASLGNLKAQLQVQRARIAEAGIALERARLALKRSVIVAPTSGRTAQKNVEPGQYIQVGEPLVSLIDPQRLWVMANFKETQLRRLRVGESVDIRVDAYPGITLKGSVESFQPGTGSVFSLLPPENATGNFVKVVQRVPVRIRIDSTADAKHPLWPGLSVTPSVKTPPNPFVARLLEYAHAVDISSKS